MALENKEQIYTEKSTLKNWFRSKLKPTQGQFWAWMDSYWHKGEKLPINTIDGLGEAVDGKAPLVHYHEQYATNDATSLSVENITQWKKKLDVDNLQFDDKAISLTGEYTDFGLNHTSKQSQFNEAMYASNQTKLNEPTSEGTEEEYPFLVGIDEDGYSAKLPAGDLGKNFANTDLQVLENRKHTGSANMEFAMPLVCSNASQKLTNLPNKSKVSTANQFVVQDHVTKELGYADNVINALTGTMRLASDAEKDAWRVAILKSNETYKTAKPIITAFNKKYINKLLPYKQNFNLLGVNLYVNPSTSILKMIKVKDESGNPATHVEYRIIDFSVYYNNSAVLSFFLDFSIFEKGSYAFKLINQIGIESDLSREFVVTDKSVVNEVNATWIYNGDVSRSKNNDVTNNNSVNLIGLNNSTSHQDFGKRECKYYDDSLLTPTLINSGFLMELDFTVTGSLIHETTTTSFNIVDNNDSLIFGIQSSTSNSQSADTLIISPTNESIRITGMSINGLGYLLSQKVILSYKDGVLELTGILNNGQFFYSRTYLMDLPFDSHLNLQIVLGGNTWNNTGVTSKGVRITNLVSL